MSTEPANLSAEKIIQNLNTDSSEGLDSSEARSRLEKYGPNKLEKEKKTSLWRILLDQFLDPIIYILTAAFILAAFFGDWIDALAILTVIIVSTLIGFLMEWQALRSVEALQNLVESKARVIRNGEERTVPTEELVPGDILVIQAGDVVPADARIIQSQGISINESALTGESVPVDKSIEPLPEETPVTDQTNMIFKGTIVNRGNGYAVITATGPRTQIGEISSLIHGAESTSTPLEKRLRQLSKRLIYFTLILAALLIVVGYLQGEDLLFIVETSIALAVAAIPEGLPIVATITLARGMIRLSRKKVIIKKLQSVQTLGETGIICTDKTGTLTENKMSVHSVALPGDSILSVEAGLYKNAGHHPVIDQLTKVAVLCNNAHPDEDENQSDAIEIGLLKFATQMGYDIGTIRDENKRMGEIPFDSDAKRMITLHQTGADFEIEVKGGLDAVLKDCTQEMTGQGLQPVSSLEYWQEKANQLADEGLRILAFAYGAFHEKPNIDTSVHNLVFLGLIGFLDPPRKDVRQAIETYRKASIDVVMITGDHPGTARKIGEEIGLISTDSEADKVVHGQELNTLDQERMSEKDNERLLSARIFARMVPRQKLDLITFYQNNNITVGMLGDGINDAPALKKADIGIAMGQRGTEAAKEAADVILMNDQFTSTELAVRQGRNIFENIRQFVVFLLSCNLAEIISVTVTVLSGLPTALLPLQILFLNLVTDVFPALALGMGEGEESIMDQPPRDPREPIITRKHWNSIIVYGVGITAAVVAVGYYSWFIMGWTEVVVNNMSFYTLIAAQLFNVFNIPHRNVSLINNNVTRNPWVWGGTILSVMIMVIAYHIPFLQQALSLVPLTFPQFWTVVLFGFGSLVLIQILKRGVDRWTRLMA